MRGAIDKQATLEALDSLYFDTVDDHDRTKERIKRMPTAQPDTDCNTCLRQACPHRDGTIRVNCPLWKGSAV